MPRFLVTGSSGFIGRHLSNFLEGQGHQVIRTDVVGNPDFLFDLRKADWEAVNLHSLDGVIHLGAKISVHESFINKNEYSEVNVEATDKLFQECVNAKVPKVIFASSAAVYGFSDRGVMKVGEEFPPGSPYAENKKIGEEMAKEHSNETTRFLSFRFFNVYGPSQSHDSDYAAVIPIFISKMLSGAEITIHGDGTQTRDFIHVNDICRTIHASLISEIPTYSVHNLGTGKAVSISDLANILKKILIDLGLKPPEPIFSPPREGDIKFSIADVSELDSLIDPNSFTSLDDGLRDLVKRTLDESNA